MSRKLGYEIEQVRVMATTTELLQDSLMMEDRMIRYRRPLVCMYVCINEFTLCL